jgi:hypothetical protein
LGTAFIQVGGRKRTDMSADHLNNRLRGFRGVLI